jgi:hypothetical protein
MTTEAFEVDFIYPGLRCPRLWIWASSLFLELNVSEIVISRLAPCGITAARGFACAS